MVSIRIRAPRKDTLVCACLCFATALLSFGLFMLQDGGAFTLREDFDFQQMPFTMGLHNQIVGGGIAGWCWNLDLGASVVQGFGFYELGSPFFWLSMLFPASAFPYVVGWIYVLKYTVAGITAHLYIRRFVGDGRCATAGALLYAFAGFQTTNLLFYHFHDVVALFPLLLIGLERLLEDRRDVVCFTFAVFLNAITNYFFFVQSTVFLLLYFGFRFGPRLRRERRLLSAIGRCMVLGVLGVGMAAALMVPSFVYMLSNPRAGSAAISLDNLLQNLLWDPWQLLFQIQGFLLPADPMFDHNAVIDQQWTSTSCWLPMVGISLTIAYLRDRRDWLVGLLVALFVICLSPLLTSSFTLFTNVYQRWWYMLVLMCALASAIVMGDPSSFRVKSSAMMAALIVIAFAAVVVVGSQVIGAVELFHADRFALQVALALAGIVATFLLFGRDRSVGDGMARRGPSPANRWRVASGCVAAFAVATTALTIGQYRQNLYEGELLDNISVEEQRMGTLNALALGARLEGMDPQYRYATGDNRLTLTGAAAGVSSFSSTISPATGRLEELYGTPATSVWHLNKSTVPGLTELLGGRYHVTTSPGAREVVAQHEVGGVTYYVTSEDACPIGFTARSYVLKEDAEALPMDQRAATLMQTPAVAREDEGLVARYAQRAYVGAVVGTADFTHDIAPLISDAQSRAVKNFWRSNRGFGFDVAATEPELVYISVPHDDGWSAYVDGRETPTVDSAGMTLLPVEAGRHEVRFTYETPGLRMGVWVAVASWLLFAALVSRWVLPFTSLVPRMPVSDDSRS